MATSTLTNLIAGSGYVRVQWTDAEEPADFYAWRLYYRGADETLWSRVFETQTSQASYTVNLYAWANRGTQEVVLVWVTQHPTTGELTESAYTGANSFSYTGPSKYSLVHPTNPAYTVQLDIVTDEQLRDGVDAQVIELLDVDGEGGRRKVNVGGSFGTEGSLTATIYDSATLGTARAQRIKIRDLIRGGTPMFLRDPFGGMTPIFITSADFKRIAGLGTSEGVEVDLEYVEIDGGSYWPAIEQISSIYEYTGSAWALDPDARIFVQKTGDPNPTGMAENDIVVQQQ